MGYFHRMEVAWGLLQALMNVDFHLTTCGRRQRFLVYGCLIALQRILRRTHHNLGYEGRRGPGTHLCRRCLPRLQSHRLSHRLSHPALDQMIVQLWNAYLGTLLCPLPQYSAAPQARHHGYSAVGRDMPIGLCSGQLPASRCRPHQTAGC